MVFKTVYDAYFISYGKVKNSKYFQNMFDAQPWFCSELCCVVYADFIICLLKSLCTQNIFLRHIGSGQIWSLKPSMTRISEVTVKSKYQSILNTHLIGNLYFTFCPLHVKRLCLYSWFNKMSFTIFLFIMSKDYVCTHDLT